MRRTVIAFTILILSVGMGIFSFIFVKNTCNEAITGIEEIMQSAVTENREEVNQISVQTNREWKEKVFLLNILIGRADTGEVEKLLNKIVFFAERADYESVISNAEDCKEELAYIIESNEPKLSTVF